MGGTDYQLITQLAGQYPALDFLGIFLARYLPYFIGIAFIAFFVLMRDKRKKLNLFYFWGFSTLLANGIIEPAINFFYFRERPFVIFDTVPLVPMEVANASFPSAHAVFFFMLASVVFFGLSRKWGAWMYVAATLVSLARVYVGVHFLLDVIVGGLIGFLVVLVVRSIFSKFGSKIEPIAVESEMKDEEDDVEMIEETVDPDEIEEDFPLE